ncbi:PREDICTED: uncharacterized protein LOC106813709 [Priapulus caudatus]|uniref:Uncharacterized protein LOC106813709 n=1 Tax=Priapulus caudatus TaxID=37621 RepID=A0ABM1EMI3_PRICU|nr:PREDICTED: uncharacterized protein LOC106813709 [Priapulus caudatus]
MSEVPRHKKRVKVHGQCSSDWIVQACLVQSVWEDLAGQWQRCRVRPAAQTTSIAGKPGGATARESSDTDGSRDGPPEKRRRLLQRSGGGRSDVVPDTSADAVAAAAGSEAGPAIPRYSSISEVLSSIDEQMKQLVDTLESALQDETQPFPTRTFEGICVLVEVVVVSMATHRSESRTTWESWMPSRSLAAIVELCASVVCRAASSQPPEVAVSAYSTALRLVGALLYVTDLVSVEMDQLQVFTWIASLPWLSNETSWVDLRLGNASEVGATSAKLTPLIDVSVRCNCLSMMAQLPRDVAPGWRTHVLRVAMSDGSSELRAAATRGVTSLLQRHGNASHHLVFDLLHPRVEDSDKKVQIALAEMIGRTVCVMAGTSRFVRPGTPAFVSPLCLQMALRCDSCGDGDVGRLPARDSRRRERRRQRQGHNSSI